MRTKFFKAVLFVFLASLASSKAYANLIVGHIYEDLAGAKWEYLGSFDLADGAPHWSTATPYNGLEAASIIFGIEQSMLATSAFELQANIADIIAGLDASEPHVVNHLAWYDGNGAAVQRFAEDIVADVNGDGAYTLGTDVSAWVDDRAWYGDYFTHAFKATEIPEPATLGVMLLALFALRKPRRG